MLTRIAAACLPVALLFSACSTSGAKYVEKATGYAITRGNVLSVADLSSNSNEDLSDGVAIKVAKAGCTVTMQLGTQREKIEVGPDAILIYSRSGDYVLLPYRAIPAPGTAPQPKEPKAAEPKTVEPPTGEPKT